LALFVLSLSLVLIACGGAPAQQNATPTTAPATAATADSAADAAEPTTAPSAATSAPSGSSSDGVAMRFVLDPQASEARYRVREQLARLSFPSDAVGTTTSLSGQIVIRPDGTVVSEESKIVVDLTTLVSDENRRDNFIKNNTLQTNQFSTAEFFVTELRGLPSPLPASGEGSFQIIGDLTVRGVTRPATWDATARYDGTALTGTATTSFTFGDFGMTPPQVFVVLSVDDNIRLELDFRFVRE
jgi:polyisoprenoid-binding protein YceI